MEVIIEKYEHIVMECAVQQSGEFSVADLHHALCSAGMTKLGKASVQILLDQLVKKKLLKKRYSRIKCLRFQPLYRACWDQDFYLKHIEAIDCSNERHKKALDAEQARRGRMERNPIYRFLHYGLAPGIVEQEYLSEEERMELRKKIDELL